MVFLRILACNCLPFLLLSGPWYMEVLRDRAHNLLNLLTDDELVIMWALMQTQFYDLYMLSAVESAKENFKPGDLFSREEARAILTEPLSPSLFDDAS